MGDDTITKAELTLFTEVNSRSAVALEKIATHLENIVAKQDKILEKVDKSIPETIVKQLTDNLDNCVMATDIQHTKWLVGIVGITIIIVSVIFNGLDRRSALASTVKEILKAEELLK